VTSVLTAAFAPAMAWEELEDGLDRAEFDGGAVTVLRADPEKWELRVASTKGDDAAENLTVKEWCEREGFAVAVNAGMFAEDLLTHIGFLGCGGARAARANKYQSAAAFRPRRRGLPQFRIFDLDETPLAEVREDYECVVQNLRLIKRPGENRWSAQERRWSETALGEDSAGRMLFIHCTEPRSMHDLNETLLSLPIDLVCAQHLEGGPQAQLVFRDGGGGTELVGGREIPFARTGTPSSGWPVPSVLGIVRRR
jgi:hypothetical protein